MRKITQNAVAAFNQGRDFRSGNTKVIVKPDVIEMYLHGHKIAWKHPHERDIYISMCGWPTVTTRERINGILAPYSRIYQRKGKQFFSIPGFDTEIELNPEAVYSVADLRSRIITGE